MSNWQTKKLGEICDFIGGGTPSKNISQFWNGEIPWASIKDIKGQFLTKTSDFITKEGLENSASNLADTNDIILATRINPGRPIITKIQTSINQDLKIVKPKIEINQSFLYYTFKNIENEVIKLSNGTTVLGITLNSLNEIQIPLPDLTTQQTIVSKIEELFSDLDKGLEDLKKAQQQLKTFRQSVLKWAFEGKLTNKNVKDGELPKGWEMKKLGEVCDMKAGNFVQANLIEQEKKEDNYRCFGGNGLRGYVKSFTHDGRFALIGRQGALCGNVHYVEGIFHATEHAVVVTPKSQIEIKCLYYKLVEMKLNKHASGVAQPGLSVNKILPLEIMFPQKIQEQERIVSEIESRLSVADKMEESIAQSIKKAESLRQSILKKAFSGELV